MPKTPPTAKPAKPKKEKKEEPEKEPEKPVLFPTATKVYCDLSDSYLKGDSWKEDVRYADGIAVVQVEDLYKALKKHPEASGEGTSFEKNLAGLITAICDDSNGKPLIVSIGNYSVADYKGLPNGTALEKVSDVQLQDHTAGLPRLSQHKEELKHFINAIKHVRNTDGWRTVSVAVSYSATPDHLVEFKKTLSANGLRRSSTFNIYLNVDTPSEAMILDEFVESGIDGIIVNVKTLAKHMMAASEDDDSIVRLLENIRGRSPEIPSILQTPADAEKVVASSVKLGYSAITVPSPDIQKARNVIAGLEHKALSKE